MSEGEKKRVTVNGADRSFVTVVGAGLAGCEAAVQLALRGIGVKLLDMKPVKFSPAHSLDGPAELVCSNSLKSDSPNNAHGLLKREMRKLGSVILKAADRARVPAGTALAVNRKEMSCAVEDLLATYPQIQYHRGREVEELPAGDVIVATGPLTSDGLAAALKTVMGSREDLYFYDALAPIVDAETINMKKAFAASRWGKGEGDDYLNCPLSREEYFKFLGALRAAPKVPMKDFEEASYFEGCLPIEVMAERGDDTLVYGPMRPVGLEHAGEMPFGVVQLRAENLAKTAYNMVGFQTKLTQEGQRAVFRMIPGLENAEFLRYGAVHRNLYINAPVVLNDGLGLVAEPRIRLAGQIVGVEGYMESAAMGLLVGWWVARERIGLTPEAPPAETAVGALWSHVRGRCGRKKRYEPMNIHFGLLPEIRVPGKRNRRLAFLERADQALDHWIQRVWCEG